MLRFLNSTPARVVTALLVLQGTLLYSSIREEVIPDSLPLADVPRDLGKWQFAQEGVVEQEVRDVLQADDLLSRSYQNGAVPASLFVAAFRSQRTGKAPHSPKNCLPGSGWEWVDSRTMPVDVGLAEPITVNRYIVARGEDRSVQHVPVTREEEGIGVCAGAYLGGKNPAMIMMNAGFLLSANALATVCMHPGIPVLMLIGHSGGIGEENPGHATVGMLTEPILQGLHVVYEKVGRLEEIRPAIKDSQMLARSSRRPVAILLNKEALR